MELEKITEWKTVHYNIPQRRGMIVRANVEVFIAGRGVGKTQGVIAERASHNAFAMPRSLGGLVVPSFMKFFSQFIPSLYAGFEALGYEEGKDYVIGKEPPKEWKRPYHRVRDWKYAMCWRNGSALAFISQDKAGSGNGLSLDYIIVEEAKLVDDKRLYADTLPAMRGNRQYFGLRSEHGSILICTDRPTNKKGKWVYRYKRDMDEEVIKMIMQAHLMKQKLFESVQGGHLSKRVSDEYSARIALIDEELNLVRKDATYYHEASILDNVEIIGFDEILRQERAMPDLLFRTSMLNEDLEFVEGGFYSDLAEDAHLYQPGLTRFTRSNGNGRKAISARTSAHDSEILSSQPLDIGCDFGGKINCLVVGQMFSDLYRVDNALYALHPKLTEDLINNFVKYYEPHKCKRVHFFYDHTSKYSTGLSSYNYKDTVINTLRKAGWQVVPVDIGETPDPELRYKMWAQMLRIRPPQGAVPIMFNSVNCDQLLMSMRLTQIREGKNGIEKNKSTEGGPIEDQPSAPHLSDAVDTLVWGRFNSFRRRGSLPAPSVSV